MSNRKQERELKQAVNKMNMNDMVKAAEQNEFRQLSRIGYLNKLAMTLMNDHPLIALSTLSDREYADEELANLLAAHIVYHDEGEFKDEEGNSAGFPIIAAFNGRTEDGKLSVEYADTVYGGVHTHFRLIIGEGNDVFVTVFCEDVNSTIIVAEGEWFTA